MQEERLSEHFQTVEFELNDERLSIEYYLLGRYSGHAAIYISQNSLGIQVWDQWKGYRVFQRTIRWNGNGITNNGNSFYVIN